MAWRPRRARDGVKAGRGQITVEEVDLVLHHPLAGAAHREGERRVAVRVDAGPALDVGLDPVAARGRVTQ